MYAICFQGLPSMDSMRVAMRFSPTGYVYNLPSANTVTAVGREVNLSFCYLTWRWSIMEYPLLCCKATKQHYIYNVQTDEFLLPFFDWKKIWTVIIYFMDLDLELHGIYFAFVPLHLTPYPVSICILSYHGVKRPQGFESCYKRHYFERTRGA